MWGYQVFEEYGKKRLKDILEKGERPVIVAGFVDYIGDSKVTECSKCGVPVLVRPWVMEAIAEHNLPVVCLGCVDPQDIGNQIATDLARIKEE